MCANSFLVSPSNLFILSLDEDETTFQYFYQFEDREVELPHLEMDNGPVSVNIRDCMLYLLSDVDPFQLRDNTILSQQWPLLKEAAESGRIIDFYNPETWGDDKTKYNPVLDIIHQQIAPNSHEQQRTESYVKAIADQSRTNVGPQRRNARIMTHSYFKRPQNESARSAEGLKEGVKQVQCAIGTANFLDEAFALVERTRLAEAYFGDEKVAVVLKRFRCSKGSQGEKQRKKKADKIKSNLDNMTFEVTCNAEKAGKAAITPSMGGGVQMSELTKAKGRLPELKAECLARQAICNEETNETINEESIGRFSVNELKQILKKDELKKRSAAKPEESLQLKDITSIVPVSEPMKVLLMELVGSVDEEEADEDEYEP